MIRPNITKTNLLIIVVLYNRNIIEVPYINMLKDFLSKSILNPLLVVYDNSLEENANKVNIPENAVYFANKNNPGLAIPYNFALNLAIDKHSKWLMLLDHDTLLTEDYFLTVDQTLSKTRLEPNVVAVIPTVVSSGRIISPVKSTFFNYHKPLNEIGIVNGEITGINSGSIINTEFLNTIGGFNIEYPLDYLDHWLFYTINKFSKFILVTNSVIHQDLSIYNSHETFSERRYESIMLAKSTFYNYKGIKYRMRLKFSLLKSIFIQLYTNKRSLAKITIKYFFK